MSVLYEGSRRRQYAIMNIPCFVGICVLLYGPLASATTCNYTLPAGYSPSVIVSPGYPNNYLNGLDCQWTITAPIRGKITVKVLYLDLEWDPLCAEDYLLFKDGTTNGARQLAKICESTSAPFVSSSNHMTIIFHSDSAVTGQGFRLQYSSASAYGFSEQTASTITWKHLTSPGYPSNYDNNLDCEWKIRAPYGYGIKVEITSLSVEYSSLCSRDYLLIKDGSSYWSRQLGKYCGVLSYKQIDGSSNYMTIIFHTDGSITGPGFNLNYKAGIHLTTTRTTTTTTTTERPRVSNCGSSSLTASKYSWRYLSSPGYPYYNYNNNMYCTWTIYAPVGYKVKVEIQTISMEYDSSCSRDYVLFSDGSSSQLGKYCSEFTGYIVSSRNAMTITFRTDISVTDKGFSLKYIARTAGCGEDYTISYETKYIESPNYPLSYPNNADCEWTINTSIDGYVIHVDVVYFNIEHDSTCSYDYVQLYDVTSFESSLGRWCGSDGPNTRTTGQTMMVKFHSDGSTSHTGFKLSFTAGEPTSDSAASTNIGALLGGVFGGITAVGIATCCCCGLCFRKKSSPNDHQQRNTNVSFINVPSYPQTPSTAPTVPAIPPALVFQPPPSYNDVVKDDPPPYCQAIPLSDIQPVVTSSASGASEYQGIDNPAGPS